jgi:hypothetical protein
MKKTTTLSIIAAGLLSMIPLTSHAATPTIAIIDTAIDSSVIPQVTYEACFTINSNCPNGSKFQEGKGAANVDAKGWAVNGMEHGIEVTKTAILANKNVNVVFIRITDVNKYPTFTAMHTDGSSLDNAIKWVVDNASKYNISVVSISQERHNFAKGTCPTDLIFSSSVQSLKLKNVPVLVGVGNDASVDFPGFPACVMDVVGVGAATAQAQNYYFSNLGLGVDLMSIGRVNITMPDNTIRAVIGTSIATPYAAALWAGKWSGNYNSQISQLPLLPKAKDSIKNLYPFLMQ